MCRGRNRREEQFFSDLFVHKSGKQVYAAMSERNLGRLLASPAGLTVKVAKSSKTGVVGMSHDDVIENFDL